MNYLLHTKSFLYLLNLIMLTACFLLLNSCTCELNKKPSLNSVRKQDIKKEIKHTEAKIIKKKQNTNDATPPSTSEFSNNKIQVINVPIQRGVHFAVEQKTILYARPKGIDPRVILENKTTNTVQSYSITNSLKINTNSFPPGGYDVYIIQQRKNTSKLSLFLIKTGEKPNLDDIFISQPLWFIQIMQNKQIRYFQDMGDGLCIYPVYQKYIEGNIVNKNTFPATIKRRGIKFHGLAPRSAQYVAFFISGLAERNLPINSFIDFFYSTRRISPTPITRMWLISGLTQKQRYNLTIQVPTVYNYDPNKYLYYKISPNLQNKFIFTVFVKGWKLRNRY